MQNLKLHKKNHHFKGMDNLPKKYQEQVNSLRETINKLVDKITDGTASFKYTIKSMSAIEL